MMIFIMMLMKPVDRSPIRNSSLAKKAMDSIRMADVKTWSDTIPVRTAFGRVNITPSAPMPMAGYARRDAFKEVHDSLYVHLALFKKPGLELFLISADLLIFPDELRDRLVHATAQNPEVQMHFSASHTHNGLGGWAEGFGGELIAGKYHPEWLTDVTDAIIGKMSRMRLDARTSSIHYFQNDASEFVKNRLMSTAPVDGMIRGLKIYQDNGDSTVVFTYSGHPTLLNRKSLALSNDYPGATIRRLEDKGYAFSMFMAGMVGSHRITNVDGKDYARIDNLARELSERIINAPGSEVSTDQIKVLDFNIPFRPSQVRLMKGLAIRDWVFSSALQPLEGTISVTRIGSLDLVGTPCDFSGELYSGINDRYKPMIITSFNGDYIGYITEDEHYEESSYMEVRTMNWVGPHYGDHFQQMINAAALRLE